jgi:hypothetical protein
MKILASKTIDASVRDSIMTTINHIVCPRVTSAGSCEELAESHVDKLFGWQPRTLSHRGEARREPWKHQVATRCLSHLKHKLPLINDNTRVC